MSTSPTQLSLKHLRNTRGHHAEVVERYLPHARVRRDLFGIGDIIALTPTAPVLIQTTSRSNLASRRMKIMDSPLLPDIIAAGFLVEAHGWRKVKNRWRLHADMLLLKPDEGGCLWETIWTIEQSP